MNKITSIEIIRVKKVYGIRGPATGGSPYPLLLSPPQMFPIVLIVVVIKIDYAL